MGALEIILILIGAVLLFGSFFITEKFSGRDIEELKEITENEMKKVVSDKLADAKVDIDDALEIAIDNAVETIDVKTDKETNNKIMQISEYSDTVLESMDKSHKEVMFMYSMLNDKHKNIVEMESRLEKLKSEIKAIDEAVAKKYSELSEKEQEIAKKSAELQQREKALELQKKVQESKEQKTMEAQLQAKFEEQQKAEEADPVVDFVNEINEKSRKNIDDVQIIDKDIPGPEDNIEGDSSDNSKNAKNSKNNKNKQILGMHDIGMSEIDIAKKLGIGLGEVKFVLGLYQEQK